MHEMDSLIEALQLQPHPEGGFYREIHRSQTIVKALSQVDKSAFTSIYYLLSGNDFSAWHRITSEEAWYFHEGCDVLIYFFDQNKSLQTVQLGLESKHFQITIPANTWFAAKPVNQTSFCLVSCAVAPGFDFDDFEIGQRETLLKEFGHSSDQIEAILALTRIQSTP